MLNDSSPGRSAVSKERDPCRIFVIEPQTIVRLAIRMMLDSNERFKVVGEAACADQALQQIRLMQPDVVLTELTLPGCPDRPILSELRSCSPKIAVLVLTERWTAEREAGAIAAGARAFVTKHYGRAELFAAINEVCAGGTYICVPRPAVGSSVGTDASHGLTPPSTRLTERQREVLRSVALGHCNGEIGRALGVSAKAVQAHRDRIRHVLNLRSTAALTAYAVREGLVSG
jgi:two-component system NarL family response regulator